jgi:hypothetical protein
MKIQHRACKNRTPGVFHLTAPNSVPDHGCRKKYSARQTIQIHSPIALESLINVDFQPFWLAKQSDPILVEATDNKCNRGATCKQMRLP